MWEREDRVEHGDAGVLQSVQVSTQNVVTHFPLLYIKSETKNRSRQFYTKRLLLNPAVTEVCRASWHRYSPTSWRPIRRSVGALTSSSQRLTTSCTGPWFTSSVCSRQRCTTSTSTSTTRKTQRPCTHRAPSGFTGFLPRVTGLTVSYNLRWWFLWFTKI